MNYIIKVAGVTFENRQDVLAAVYEVWSSDGEVEVELIPEPENPYDPCAVAVEVSGFGRIGYVPSLHAAGLTEAIEDGRFKSVNLFDIGSVGGVWYAKVRLKVRQ